jgi:hypothetical protein
MWKGDLMKRADVVLTFLLFVFLVLGCALIRGNVPSDSRVEQAVQPEEKASVEPKKAEPAQTLPLGAETERLKSTHSEIEEADLPALVRAKALAESGRASYEKYVAQRIKTGSGDKDALSDALTSYTEADKLIRALLVRYPHSDFLWTISCNVREDLSLLQMEQK